MTFQEELKQPWVALLARWRHDVKWLNFAAAMFALGACFLANGWNVIGQAVLAGAMLVPLALQITHFAEDTHKRFKWGRS